jgi:hypothetical protein
MADKNGFFFVIKIFMDLTSTCWSLSAKTNQFQLVEIKIRFEIRHICENPRSILSSFVFALCS